MKGTHPIKLTRPPSISTLLRHWPAPLIALLLSPALRAVDAKPYHNAIATLTDPAKLAALKGDRAANDRLHKILAVLEQGRRNFLLPSQIIDEAQKITGDPPDHAAMVKEMLLLNFELCGRSAIFTPDNLARMSRGESPLVPSGTFIGQRYEVDQIIPVYMFPKLRNELANLIYLPRTQNRRKSDDIKQRAIDHGTKLVTAKILTAEDYARLCGIRQWGTSSGLTLDPVAEREQNSSIVNLNTADTPALEALPGIGPKTAAAIKAARPIKSWSDLDKVPGIGPKTIGELRPLVTF